MSTIDAQAVVYRVREVLEDNRGTLRKIAAGVLKGGLPSGLDVNEEARRAIGALAQGQNVPTESRITRVARSAASPPVIGNLAFYDIELEVRQVYPGTSREKLDDDKRDAVAGLAAAYADTIAQALTYPGNLTQTESGRATGLVSGMLAYVDSSYRWNGTVSGSGMTLEAVHRFKGVVKSAPAIS